MIRVKQAEPPSWLRPPLFMLGQNLRGNWVVQQRNGTRGGLFVDREAALRFIRAETGYRPQAVVMVSAILELDTGCEISAVAQRDIASDSQTLRRIA
jgi:hypothetical protein